MFLYSRDACPKAAVVAAGGKRKGFMKVSRNSRGVTIEMPILGFAPLRKR